MEMKEEKTDFNLLEAPVYVTIIKKPYDHKPNKDETKILMNNFKIINRYKKENRKIPFKEFENALYSGFPHKCCSWTESKGLKEDIKNYKSNIMCFDVDEGIKSYKKFEDAAIKMFHIVQRSSSWGEPHKEPEGIKYKYHCYLVLDDIITDFKHYEAVYKEYAKRFEKELKIPLDKSIDSTKMIFAGQREEMMMNLSIPLAPILEVEPEPEVVPKDVPELETEINFERFKECMEKLNDKGLFSDYTDWINTIFSLIDMHQNKKITYDQLIEIGEIIDDGEKETSEKIEREVEQVGSKLKKRTSKSIYYLCRQHGLENEIKEAFGFIAKDEKNNVIPEPFYIKGNSLYKTITTKKDEEMEVLISRFAPSIIKEFSNIERSSVHFEIDWKNRGREHREVVPANVIATKKDLLTLAEKGFSCHDNNSKDLITFFDKYLMVNELEQAYMVERLGHIKNAPFIHPLESNGIEIIPNDAGEKQLLEAFQVKGTVDSWKSEVFDLIKEHPKVLFYVLSSFASVVLKDLKIEPFIVEISGSTSQGKTTAMQVAKSVHGTEGLINEWNATKVAIERKAGFLNSFPLYMDDTRKADERVIQSIVYQFSGGRSKGRGSIRGSQKEFTWNNILLSTGEVAITEFAKKAGGAAARVISLVDEPFVHINAGFFDQLYQGLENNYGAVGLEFVKRWEQEKQDYLSQFHLVRQHYLDKSRENEVLTRLSMYYAAVHFAGLVAQKFFNLDMNLKSLIYLFDEMAKENKAIDKPKQLLEDILSTLDSNRKYIAYDHYVPETVWAIYKYGTISFTPKFLNEQLGIEEKTIRKEWQKRGLTVTHINDEKETDYFQVKIKGRKFRAISINKEIFEDMGFDYEEEIVLHHQS